MTEKLPHIFYEKPCQSRKFTTPPGGGGNNGINHRNNKKLHCNKLLTQFDEAWKKSEEQKKIIGVTDSKGYYFEFMCIESYGLNISSLENRNLGIEISRISKRVIGKEVFDEILVFIPKEQRSYFIKKIKDYLTKFTKNGKPRNQPLIESIEEIQLAVLESFWKEIPIFKNEEESKWCEVWIRTTIQSIDEEKKKFLIDLDKLGIENSDGCLDFAERSIFLIKANKIQLTKLIETSSYIAEFNVACEINELFYSQDNTIQSKLVESILSRVEIDIQKNVSIIILDTGINNGHKLLSQLLLDQDCHAYNPEWGTEDHNGHGTEMAGICVYGDLGKVLLTNNKIEIRYKLESCKILPPVGENNPKLYGYITQQAVYLKEVDSPKIKRIICMAIASEECDIGHPSSWSAAVDQLAFGESDYKRLILIPAGNILQNEIEEYPDSNLMKAIRNPGQSWNALTIGAFTEKDRIIDARYANFIPVANFGEISPSSSTSYPWFSDNKNEWPNKPDIVFEGGNYCYDNEGSIWKNDNLNLLTTNKNPQNRQFALIADTSAATALASKMAGQIQAEYPYYWPETIRALMVHSAKWTEGIINQFENLKLSPKQFYARLLRICGYGVPNLDNALYSASKQCNLIIQREIQPYILDGKEPKTNEMHLYELPWPKDELLKLGETKIILRITLSYFIDPSPGEIGWHDRYRYASYGLRFKLNRPNEDQKKFCARINKADKSEKSNNDGSDKWKLGENQRNLGTIHSDTWEGTAADLSKQNMVAVFPILGWWKERKHLEKYNSKARYSLIVSLESPKADIDLYNLILTKIETEQKVATKVEITN